MVSVREERTQTEAGLRKKAAALGGILALIALVVGSLGAIGGCDLAPAGTLLGWEMVEWRANGRLAEDLGLPQKPTPRPSSGWPAIAAA